MWASVGTNDISGKKPLYQFNKKKKVDTRDVKFRKHLFWGLKTNPISLDWATLWTYKRQKKVSVPFIAIQHMEWRTSMPHTQKVAHLNTSQYDTFAGKSSPVFSSYLFIPFLPTWQGVTILPFIDCSPSKSHPTPGWDLLLMWSLQFNLSMRTYKGHKDLFNKTYAPGTTKRDSITRPYEIHQPCSTFHVVKHGSAKMLWNLAMKCLKEVHIKGSKAVYTLLMMMMIWCKIPQWNLLQASS